MCLCGTLKWRNGADTSWQHIIVVVSLKTSLLFAVFTSEHVACRSCFLHCIRKSHFFLLCLLVRVACRSRFLRRIIGSQTKVRTANHAAKLTASTRWGILKMADNHFLWRQLEHCLLALYFQLYDPFLSHPIHHLHLNPLCSITDAEINVSSAENPVLSKVLSLKP